MLIFHLLDLRKKSIKYTKSLINTPFLRFLRRERLIKNSDLMRCCTDLDILRAGEEKKPISEPFFSTLDGERINDRYLRAMVKRRARKARITKRRASSYAETYLRNRSIPEHKKHPSSPEGAGAQRLINHDGLYSYT